MSHHTDSPEHLDQDRVASQPKGKKADWNQEDVLKHKDHVTQGSLGLQIWGDESTPDSGHAGTATQGTAERQATIKRGQSPQADAADAKRGQRSALRGQEQEAEASDGEAFDGGPDRSREQPT